MATNDADLIASLRGELENVKLAATLLEETKNEEIGVIRQRYEGEIASLNRVLKEAVAETVRSTESDVLSLHRQNQWLEMQLRDLRNQIESNAQSDGGFVSSIMKSIKLASPSQLGPHSTDHHSPRSNPSHLSQEQLDQLKPIVLPFQQEIQKLKTQLTQQSRVNKDFQQKLSLYEKKLQVAGIIPESAEDSSPENSSGNGPKLPVSRGDLEIYVSVLRTQKQVLQDDMREARQQLLNIRSAIGDSQIEMKEMLQLGKQLSSSDNPVWNSEDPSGEPTTNSISQWTEKLTVLQEKLGKLMETATSEDLLHNSETSDSRKMSIDPTGELIQRSVSNLASPSGETHNDSGTARKSVSLSDLHKESEDAFDEDVHLRSEATELLPGGSMSSQRPPTLDIHSSQQTGTFDTVLREKSPTPSTSSQLSSTLREEPGKTPISSSAAACDMCDNYEHKLQQAQEGERLLRQERDTLKALADRQKEEIMKEREYRTDLEMKTNSLADETSRDVSRMFQLVTKLQEELSSCKTTCEETLASAKRFVENAIDGRTQVELESDRIQQLYDKMLGKHRQLADQMRNEFIDLPDNQEELQLHCLKLREELIEERAAKEHLDESLRSEVAFLRSQVDSLQHEREQLEDSLTEEVNNLRTQLGVMQSKTNQIQEQLKLSQAKEEELTTAQLELEKLRLELSQTAAQGKKLTSDKEDLMKRIHTLLTELNTSESVQKDFVLLSQNLQTQLEKIRQAEHEVRWQHDDDVTMCNSCRLPFIRSRPKQHCWHCGRIFCPSCIPKTVASGPGRRPVPVCDVCHTILERDTRPFFTDRKTEAD